jgi:hypothetical protein
VKRNRRDAHHIVEARAGWSTAAAANEGAHLVSVVVQLPCYRCTKLTCTANHRTVLSFGITLPELRLYFVHPLQPGLSLLRSTSARSGGIPSTHPRDGRQIDSAGTPTRANGHCSSVCGFYAQRLPSPFPESRRHQACLPR